MPSIFISYRRQDTLDTARLIDKLLRPRIGQDEIFFDGL